MSRKTTGASRRVVGTALLGVTALVGSGFAFAADGDAAITKVTVAVGNDAPVGPLAGGTSAVRIEGTNLDKATSIWFGGVKSTRYTVESPTLAYATPPAVEDANDKDTYKVDVQPDSAATTQNDKAADDYTYTAGPVVTSVKTVEKTVEVTGTQLLGATAVLFGDTLVKVDTKKLPATATKVTVKAPSLKGGSYSVSVVSPLGIGTKTAAWGAAPVLSKLVLASEFGSKSAKAVTRASAATGTVLTTPAATNTATGTVLIATGSGFNNLTSIKFGKAAAAFVVLDDTTVRLVIPKMDSTEVVDPKTGTTYPVFVVATNATGSSKNVKFQYDALPTISKVSDVVGLATSSTNTVTITGKNLDKAKVKVGTATGKVTANTTDTLTFTVGKGNPEATGDIVVTTSAGTVTGPKYTWKAVDALTPFPAS